MEFKSSDDLYVAFGDQVLVHKAGYWVDGSSHTKLVLKQNEIEIWDYDFISPNDLLGVVKVYIDEPGGPYSTDMVPNKKETKRARYTLEWEIDFDY